MSLIDALRDLNSDLETMPYDRLVASTAAAHDINPRLLDRKFRENYGDPQRVVASRIVARTPSPDSQTLAKEMFETFIPTLTQWTPDPRWLRHVGTPIQIDGRACALVAVLDSAWAQGNVLTVHRADHENGIHDLVDGWMTDPAVKWQLMAMLKTGDN